MPRICGVDIPKEKRIEIALTYIHGVGKVVSSKVLQATSIAHGVKAKNLTEEEVARLTSFINKNYKTEGDLRRDVAKDIKRLIDIGCYRGMRHKKGLPARGQRTSTNSRTRKGPRKTVGITRKSKATSTGKA